MFVAAGFALEIWSGRVGPEVWDGRSRRARAYASPVGQNRNQGASLAGGGGDDELLLVLLVLLPPAATSKQRAGLQQVWSRGKARQAGCGCTRLTLHSRRFEEEDEVRVSEYPARCRTTRGAWVPWWREGGKCDVIGDAGGGGLHATPAALASTCEWGDWQCRGQQWQQRDWVRDVWSSMVKTGMHACLA